MTDLRRAEEVVNEATDELVAGLSVLVESITAGSTTDNAIAGLVSRINALVDAKIKVREAEIAEDNDPYWE